MHDAQKELAELKNSASGEQAATVIGLRKQNEALTTKVNALQKDVARLEAERQQTAQHLDTARDALALQQASLEKLQQEKERAAAVANAAACIRNLRQIDAAKLQWAVDKAKSATDVPTAEDLAPYSRDGNFPACPDGGTYAINAVGNCQPAPFPSTSCLRRRSNSDGANACVCRGQEIETSPHFLIAGMRGQRNPIPADRLVGCVSPSAPGHQGPFLCDLCVLCG